MVTSAELGTLNHTELTVATLRARGIEPTGLVIGLVAERARAGGDLQPRRPAAGDRRTPPGIDSGWRRGADP